MGNEIVYCCRCQSRLLAGDFDDGKAVWSSDKPYCIGCVMGLVSTLPPEEEQRILEQLALKRAGQAGTPAEEPPRRAPARKTSTSRIPVVKTERRGPPPGSRPAPVILLVAAVGTVIVLGVVFAGLPGGSGAPVKPPESPPVSLPAVELPKSEVSGRRNPVSVDPPIEIPAARREEAARKAFEKAREYGRTHAADLPGRIALLEQAAWECRGTSLAAEARKEHELLQRQRGDLITAELAPAVEKAHGAAAKDRYGEAIALLQKERRRLAGADWLSAVEQNILQVRQKAEHACTALKEKAVQARRRGDEEEAKAIVERVASWGVEDLASDLRSALAAIPRPERGLSPEARTYRTSWENAFALARARDYPAAVRDLESAAMPLVDPTLKAESATDLEILRLLSATHADLMQALAKWSKGQKLSVEIEGPSGRAVKVEGIVTRTATTWIELRAEPETVVVEFDELTAGSLRDLLGKVPGRKPEADARAAALFLILEGDPAGAAGLPPEALPARIRSHGARIAEERSRPESMAQEADARARFEAAERDYNDHAAKLDAFDRYRALVASHGESAFVRRKRAVIAQRLDTEKDAGKEYFFFADQMRAAGAFRRATHARVASCYSSASDVAQPKDNYVEVVFSAKAATEYRCWVYAGGCCAETFAFELQATELASAEPGAAQGVPVKQTILFLKKTHALHGGRKEPSRFEWIPIPLPRYASGGPKTLRFLNGQQGASVGYVLVSAVRTAAPADTVVKEWERARPAAGTSSSRDAGLVAWWTLDEGAGPAVADGSPSRISGSLRNDPVWTSGKLRGALSFDGRDDHVEFPKNSRLYFSAPFTVAAWVNLAGLPQSEFGMYVVSDYTPDGNRCTFSIRVLPTGSAQFFWQSEDHHTSHATSATRLVPGTWVHLAGVWDGALRTVYVNGAPDGVSGTPQSRADIRGNTSIGRPGSFNGLYFNGRIDDVRLYDRALSSAQIQSLAGR